MEYPIALGLLAAYFAVVGVLAFRDKRSDPEPPPKGGVQDRRTRVSFTDFHRARAAERQRDTVLAQRRTA
jgi:hypothetical protein